MSSMTIASEYQDLDGGRQTKIQRARFAAHLTIPQIMPPDGFDETQDLVLPYSSVGAMGVVSLASKMLSAMLPVDGTPFFRFEPADGQSSDPEAEIYLEQLTYRVNRKLQSKNLRDSMFQALQELIINGDTLFIMNDDFTFYTVRLDQYVVVRNPEGTIDKFIYLEMIRDPDNEGLDSYSISMVDPTVAPVGYTAVYNEVTFNRETGMWDFRREIDEEIVETGTYSVLNMTPVRWSAVNGEDYGRAKCEEMMGDLQSLESYTTALIEAMAAASRFYVGINPAGLADIDDIVDTPNGGFIGAKPDDIFVVSPSQTMNPNIQSLQTAVSTMRNEVSKQFLINGGSVRDAERVTAAEIRMVGQELEQVLGGAFSAIARELISPIIRRAFFLMVESGDIDPKLADTLNEGGLLNAEVVTGLQAFSRDADLANLMQMGNMVQSLPQPAQERFNWEAYANTLVSSLGFDPRAWVKTDEQIATEQAAQQQQQLMQAAEQQVIDSAGQAINTDITQNGGAGVAAAMQGGMIPPMM